MSWKRRHRSFYTRDFPEPDEPELARGRVALLVVDVQNAYVDRPHAGQCDDAVQAQLGAWEPFHARMRAVVLPNIVRLLGRFRGADLEVAFVRLGGRREDGRDRPRMRRLAGHPLLLADDPAAQVVAEIAPLPGEFVASKTGDSALAGTGLGLALRTLGITDVVVAGVLTDQCISSTVRALADADFAVVLAEDACAAGTDAVHAAELATLNLLYCLVMTTDEVLSLLPR
ncbi:MAG: isochorismatase family cysteine hydrolase [Amaricoccus sp.]|uniref:cysteine hydrolase family protein n=1 Tax=Amaricoccus sp. TaxID=1872485 RepID=UPI0039E6C5B7